MNVIKLLRMFYADAGKGHACSFCSDPTSCPFQNAPSRPSLRVTLQFQSLTSAV